jgi:WD40 repeat protein
MSRYLSIIAGAAATALLATTPVAATPAPTVDDWTPTGTTVLGGPASDPVRDLVITSDGRRALVLGDSSLRQLDLTKDPARLIGTSRALFGSAVAVRGRKLAYVGDDRQLHVVGTGRAKPRKLRTLHEVSPTDVSDLAVSPDGRFLYLVHGEGWSGSGGQVWSLAKPKRPRRVASFDLRAGTSDVAVSPDGTRLVISQTLGATVAIVDVAKPTRPRVVAKAIPMPNGSSTVDAVITGNSKLAYLVSDDEPLVVKLNLKRRTVVGSRRFPAVDHAVGIDRSPDGRHLYVTIWAQGDDPSVYVLRAGGLRVATAFTGAHYPGAPVVSTGGPTRGTAYFYTAASTILDHPLLFVGIRPGG